MVSYGQECEGSSTEGVFPGDKKAYKALHKDTLLDLTCTIPPLCLSSFQDRFEEATSPMERPLHGINLGQASATGLVRKALDRILESRLGRSACKSEMDNGELG